jgi:hypothetical protein
MNRPYAFGIRTHHERFKLDERISVPRLAGILGANGLCLSTGLNGEQIIHQPRARDGIRAISPGPKEDFPHDAA